MPDGKEIDQVEKRIYSTFSELASSIGFSPIHGNIIAALLVSGGHLSLQGMAKRTGYSASMVSLSLDLLEILGIIKKVKKPTDRKLYVELSGDLLESLKRILLIKIKKAITDSLKEFEDGKEKLKNLQGHRKEEVLKAINVLEKEIKRLENYIEILSNIELP